MAEIQTVTGRIPFNELGVAYCHEHLLFWPPEPTRSQDPDLALDSLDAAIEEVQSFSRAGGQALVEMSTVDLNRQPEGLRAISEATGVHILAATGFNKGKYCEELVSERTVNDLAAGMVRDLTVGMGNTTIRAGLIKASSSKDVFTAGEQKVFQAAIKAHRETGAPISTHTEAGTLALEQVKILTAGKVSPERILIGHVDRKLEWETIAAIADTGVSMGFDQISKEKYFPDLRRIEYIRRLVETGHGAQIVLSGDLARKAYWPSYGFGKGPGLTYILWRFVPWMLEEGIPREAVKLALNDNPAQLFAWV